MPLQVKVGSVVVKIYPTKNRGRVLHAVAYHIPGKGRQRKNFADLTAAKLEAQRIAQSIHQGELEVLKLTNVERTAYLRALEFLNPSGHSIEMAAQEYSEAAGILAGTASLVEAAKFYAKHHPAGLVRRTVTDVVDEMLSSKLADGMGDRHISDLEHRLGRFAERFATAGIVDVTTSEMQDWLATLGIGHRSRNNFRATLVSLFNFAKKRGYLPKQQPTEADALSKAKGPESPIGIFTPEEMTLLLDHADDSLVPYLAIGGFAGLRTAELQRLSWSEVKLEQGYIEVTAAKAKTAQRRLVPIQANLAGWLRPYAARKGLVSILSTINQKASDFAKQLGVGWPHNALRHSYASYRLAKCKNAAEVSLEMGNSPRMIFNNYRELVTPVDAEQWWAIAPATPQQVVPISVG